MFRLCWILSTLSAAVCMSDTCGDVAYTDAEALYPGTDITEILPEEQQKVTVAVLTPEDDADTDVQIAYVIGKIQEMMNTLTSLSKQ